MVIEGPYDAPVPDLVEIKLESSDETTAPLAAPARGLEGELGAAPAPPAK